MIHKTKIKKKLIEYGFGLADAILSLTLLGGIITYGVYFSSLRLNTVHSSNLIRSVNKEIERDIERLKLDLWSLLYVEEDNGYKISKDDCLDLTKYIISLPSWQTDLTMAEAFIQSWRPGGERSKVFSGQKVLISRELNMSSPVDNNNLNLSIATVNYRVEWGNNNIHWLSIDLGAEAHSWCEEFI